MNPKIRVAPAALALGIALGFATAPVLAEKPDWAGEGKGHGKGKQKSKHFDDDKRVHVRSYYDEEFRGGNCPPGLAKKNNGCLPPGQAKKVWVIGQPLPASVVFYSLPGVLLGQLTPAPSGYQYVQVASDILMMAIGTRMIVSAVADLAAM